MMFNRSFFVLALSLWLAGCGNSVTDFDSNLDPKITRISGEAVKGVIGNAIVTAYKFEGGESVALTIEELDLVSSVITTDLSGSYSFNVRDYIGPIKIELSTSNDIESPTTMICDAPSGCGDVIFGDSINLTVTDPSFKLSAIAFVDDFSESDRFAEIEINVTALTHLAAQLIEVNVNSINAEIITTKLSTLASNFGITSSLTLLKPTETTDVIYVVNEGNGEELRYALVNAGIMEAIFSGESDTIGVLSSKFEKISDDIIKNDGALLVNKNSDDGFVLSLRDVLTGATDVADLLAEPFTFVSDLSAEDLTKALSRLNKEKVYFANALNYQESIVGDDGLVGIDIYNPTDGNEKDKAKAMVADVRLLSHLFDITTTRGEGIKTQGDEYVALLNNASSLVNQEADSFTLLAKISGVVADLAVEYQNGTLTDTGASASLAIPDGILPDTGTGTITYSENTDTNSILFSINATDTDELLQLDIIAEFSTDGLNITLTLDGLIESSGAIVTIKDGSLAKIDFDNDTLEKSIISGELDLQLDIAQKVMNEIVNPVTFSGVLQTKLLGTLDLPETLSLDGNFSSLESNLVKAILTTNINNIIDVNNISAALTLETVLNNSEVKLQLSGENTSLEQGEFDLILTYRLPDEGTQRSFTANIDEDTLQIINFENVVFRLQEVLNGTQLTGQLLVGTTEIAGGTTRSVNPTRMEIVITTEIEAATIEYRDGLVVVVYSSEDEDIIN